MTLWEEYFQNVRLLPIKFSWEEFKQAEDWIFNEGLGHAEIAMKIVNKRALPLVGKVVYPAELSAVALWRKMTVKTPIKTVSVRNLPVRRDAPIVPKRFPAE